MVAGEAKETAEAITTKVQSNKHSSKRHRSTSSFTLLHLLGCHHYPLGVQYISCLRPLQRWAQPRLQLLHLPLTDSSKQRQLLHSKRLEVASG